MAVGHARPRPRHPGEEPAWVGGVSEAAGRLPLLGGGAVGGAEEVPCLQAGVTHQERHGRTDWDSLYKTQLYVECGSVR